MVHYAHIIGIITLGSVLLAEFVLLRDEITIRDFVLIRRVDLLYGIAAIVILVSGVMRVIWFSKGWEFYLSNGVFLTKMGALVVLGLILIYPTVLFYGGGPKPPRNCIYPLSFRFTRLRRNLHIFHAVQIHADAKSRTRSALKRQMADKPGSVSPRTG